MKNKLKIEKGIELNPVKVGRSTLEKMGVGDSVVVDKKMANTLRNCAYYLFFRTRQKKQSDGNIRVWRVK